MSQANETITLKIHDGDDIRRFHLSRLDWSELTGLLSSNYPTPYTLKYRDTDNDMVTMVAQHDLQDASEMSQGGVLHLYVVGKDAAPAPTVDHISAISTSTPSAPDVDMTSSSADDLASQLSHEEMSTLLSECLSDPTVITAIAPFLTTFIDQLTTNMSTATPLSTSWSQSLQQHTSIRDHVILSVLLPRLQTSLAKADQNHMATRIPPHILLMVKGFIPMLPMFLPSIVPMITKFMSESTTSDTQAQTNPLANSPLMSMLGPMFSGMQQPAQGIAPLSAATTATATATTATSPTNSSTAQAHPFGLLAPLLAGAAANPTNSNSASQAQAQAQANPLLGLLGPLLAANAASTGNQANPFASMFQQLGVDQPPTDIHDANTNTNTNPDYTQQLNQLESMGLGSRDLNLSLLQQWNGDVERVMEFLSTME